MSELKETKEVKVVALYEQTRKQFEPDPKPQNSLFWTSKSQKRPLNQIRFKARIEEDMKIYVVLLYEQI